MLWNIINSASLFPGQRVTFTIPGNPNLEVSGIVCGSPITANYAGPTATSSSTADLNITLENLTVKEVQSENSGA